MSAGSQSFKVRFGSHPVRVAGAEASPCESDSASTAGVARGHGHQTALYLAMAHRVEELLRAGKVGNYAGAAAWLGISPARTNMISHLALLAPALQDAILCGRARLSEHRLRTIARIVDWNEQIAAATALDPSLAPLSLAAEASPRSPTKRPGTRGRRPPRKAEP